MENYELGVKSYHGLKRYADQKNLQSNCERMGLTRSLRRLGHCKIRDTVRKVYDGIYPPEPAAVEGEVE